MVEILNEREKYEPIACEFISLDISIAFNDAAKSVKELSKTFGKVNEVCGEFALGLTKASQNILYDIFRSMRTSERNRYNNLSLSKKVEIKRMTKEPK